MAERAIQPLLLLIAVLAPGCGAPPPAPLTAPPLPNLEALLQEQTALYAYMKEADLYKLIYQATRGPSHVFMGTKSKLDTGLDLEISQMKPASDDGIPPVEMLDPRLNLARINMRPYLLGGGKASDLARAVARTAHEFRGDKAVFRASLKAAKELLPKLNVSFTAEEFETYIATMEKKGWPAGVHSELYADTYEPSYRIVLLQYLTDRDYHGRDEPPVEGAGDAG